MKVRIKLSDRTWKIDHTGKGKFAARLAVAMKYMGVSVTDKIDDNVDIDLQIGRFHYRPDNYKKIVLRFGPAHVDKDKNYKALNRRKQNTMNHVDGVVYQSEFGKKMCDIFLGEAQCKTAVIFNGAPVSLIPIIKPMGFNVLACAREWTGQKRLGNIIDAFQMANLENARLSIIGKTKPIKTSTNIHYHGQIPAFEIDEFYALSHLLIDIGYLACCDNVICEALAGGCQVLTTSASGNAELVPEENIIKEPEWNGAALRINKPPDINIEQLAQKIRMVSKRHTIDHCSYTANPETVSHINIDNIANKYISFFEDVLK